MTAKAAAALLPGAGSVPVDIAFENPNAVPISITSVTLRVASTSPAGCASAIVVARQLRTVPVIPAGSTRSLSALGVPQQDWPQLEMRDDRTNQNACQNATIQLALIGEARG